jgi:hypothetical protein
MPAAGGGLAGCRLPSDECGLDGLAVGLVLGGGDVAGLRLDPGWAKRWTATTVAGGAEVTCPVADLPPWPEAAELVRRFSWARRQRHRPGLQYMVCTGRHHGFESLAEQRLLLVLDFLGVLDVVAQPLELGMVTSTGWVRHVPDFLVSGRDGVWLIDVRPAARVREQDRLRFAGTAEVALAMGWRYLVVTGWRPNTFTTVDAVSAQRREVSDRFGLREPLVAAAAGGPVRFADLVAATALTVLARALALHLIWHRRLVVDLAVALGEGSLVWARSTS